MRWGAASVSTASPRWVRPLSGIVALLGDEVVPFAAAGVIQRPDDVRPPLPVVRPVVEIASAATYADQLRAAHVVLDPAERAAIIVERAAVAAATAAGLTLIPDAALVAENAGLTEWPVPLLGTVRPRVPRRAARGHPADDADQPEIFRVHRRGRRARPGVRVRREPARYDGGAIVAGNAKVLAARLSDAKFFWDADVARVTGWGPRVVHAEAGDHRLPRKARHRRRQGRAGGEAGALAGRRAGRCPAPTRTMAEDARQAARLCKADLVSATVGEFPEVQGIAGGHYGARRGPRPRRDRRRDPRPLQAGRFPERRGADRAGDGARWRWRTKLDTLV